MDHSQTIAGDTVKLLGDISPYPSLVSAPLMTRNEYETFATALAKQKLFIVKSCSHQDDRKNIAPPKLSCWLRA